MDSYTSFMYDLATSPQLTLKAAVELLYKDAHVRTVKDTLSKVAGIPTEERGKLQNFLTDALMDTDSGRKRDNVARKVRMWLADDVRFLRKDSAIQLCFAFKLSLKESENLMYRLCGEGFHWREPRDIVFINALMWGWTYEQSSEYLFELKQEGLLEISSVGNADKFTGELREMIQQISSPEELKTFFRENKQNFGTFHNTAYQLFTGFLNLLSEPNDLILPPDDEKRVAKERYSIRNIMNCYLYEQFIPRLKKAAKGNKQVEESVLTALQEDIRQNWPDEITISRMQHRKVDVTRKVLVLLFLATDGGLSEYANRKDGNPDKFADDLEDEDDLPSDLYFEDMYSRMNSMLIECGFAPLDSRSPFDWMVLYCMCAEDSLFIDGRMQRFLSGLFPSNEETLELWDYESVRK